MANSAIVAPTFIQINATSIQTLGAAVKSLLFPLKSCLDALCKRASKTITTDGAGTMDAPLPLERVATSGLPAAASWPGGLVYNTTEGGLSFSDGSIWHSVFGSQYIFGTTTGTVAAGATVFLGTNAAQAAETNTWAYVARIAKKVTVHVSADGAPGVGQSFTYTLRNQGADTAVVVSVTGAATGGDATAALAIGLFEKISLKLVTSAGAAVINHRWMIIVDF